MRQMTGFNALRDQSRIKWVEQQRGWVAAPEETSGERAVLIAARWDFKLSPGLSSWKTKETDTSPSSRTRWECYRSSRFCSIGTSADLLPGLAAWR